MKKLLCLALSLLLLGILGGCKNKEKKPSAPTVDLEYYAKIGTIPECPYSLGTNVNTLKKELEANYTAAQENSESDSEEMMVYRVTEGKRTVRIDNGKFLYYYEIANESAGISYLVNLDEAYGFPLGTVSLQIKEALAYYNAEELEMTAEDVFFLFGIENASGLRYTFQDVCILFVFQDNMLCATAIYNTLNWTL